MIQVIAVHCGGTLPVVMELATGGLNFVQLHALMFLPRSPSGVPELRALGKGDGQVQFRFKVPPEKISAQNLPDLLTQWDAKFTEATLKRIAKTHADERKAASAAGLWKGDVVKGDLNAMHAQCNPDEAKDFSEALATVVQKKARVSKAPKRPPKPKVLASVIEASTGIHPVTGELTAIASASEQAVTALRAREIVQLMASQGEGAEELADPLEEARMQGMPKPFNLAGRAQPGLDALLSEAAPDALVGPGFAPDHALAPEGPLYMSGAGEEQFPRETEGCTYKRSAATAQGALQAHKEGRVAGPRLIEMGIDELRRRARGDIGLSGEQDSKHKDKQEDVGASHPGDEAAGTSAGQPRLRVTCKPSAVNPCESAAAPIAAEAADTDERSPFESRFTLNSGNCDQLPDGFDLFANCEEPVFKVKVIPALLPATVAMPSALDSAMGMMAPPKSHLEMACLPQRPEVDCTGLCSFRLASDATSGNSVVLPSGEVFEALAHLELVEPLGVSARWLLQACQDEGVAVLDSERLASQTAWLQGQLKWRGNQLMRWLGKADLASPQPVASTHGEKPKKGRRPEGWVDAGVQLATLAQHISTDIAMLDMTLRDIERSIAGMPAWVIEMMQLMREFDQREISAEASAEARPKPGGAGAVFRDAWRAELQRIDRWCAVFKPIRIALQLGLFGSAADQRLLLRLEDVIARTKAWSNAPAQASRVLAVWLGFVLSIDHTAPVLTTKSAPAPSSGSPTP